MTLVFTWTKMMSAPASARAIATAWPMPLVAPVMRAVCPSSEKRALVADDMICCERDLKSLSACNGCGCSRCLVFLSRVFL